MNQELQSATRRQDLGLGRVLDGWLATQMILDSFGPYHLPVVEALHVVEKQQRSTRRQKHATASWTAGTGLGSLKWVELNIFIVVLPRSRRLP